MPPGYLEACAFGTRLIIDPRLIYIFKNDSISALKLKHISGIDYESHSTLQVTYSVFET